MTAARLNWPLLLGACAAGTAIHVARAFRGDPLLGDTDDAMRLTMVHDLLDGQAWYDLVQHRLNTPFGAEIHWSRLVDAPISGLLAVLRPVLGTGADLAAAYLWPLLLLFVLLGVSARLCVRLAGPEGMLPGVALPLFSAAVLAEFGPGRLDHHSVQIILTLALAWCTIEAIGRPRFAIAAGVLAATSIAIGVEGLPQVLAAIIALGLLWVFDPRHASALAGFGMGLLGAMLAHQAIALPTGSWMVPLCDTISIVYVVASAGVAAVFVLLSRLAIARAWARLAIGLVGGAAVLAVVVVLYPQCLGGPYADVDPWLVENWIARISEARPIWESFGDHAGYLVGTGVPVLLGLVLTLAIAGRARPPQRSAWLVMALFLGVAVVVMLVQVRGVRLAACLAIPAAACAIVALRERYLARGHLVHAGLLIVTWLAFASIVLVFLYDAGSGLVMQRSGGDAAQAAEAPAPDRRECYRQEHYATLAAMPAQRLMTPVDLGSHTLLFTPHSVVGAPYHRNERGVRDTFAFFNGPPEEAQAILAERGIALVVTCPYLAELGGVGEVAEGSFNRLAADGATPDWLTRISQPGDVVQIYAVGAASNLATPIGQLTPVP